jgi:ATP-dependent Clp protease ATP-binding subunit ClpC
MPESGSSRAIANSNISLHFSVRSSLIQVLKFHVSDLEVMRDKILDKSKRVFKPEFLNRLHDMIVFHHLERNDLVKIVDLEVAKVIARVRGKDISSGRLGFAGDWLTLTGTD